jgi:hypothetical protein
MTDECKIDLELKYPLWIKRFLREERIAIVDSAGIPVAQAVNYNHAFEIVRLANCAYKLMNDLSQKPYENPANPPDNPGRAKAGAGLLDPTQTHSPRMRD